MRKWLSVFLWLPLVLIACSPNNVTKDDSLKKYFDAERVNGCFALLDNGQGSYTIYNLSRYRDSAFLPASTFKIVNSLIGLQTGQANDTSMVIPWDRVVRPIREWNQDLTMAQAFRYSAVPWYQELARRIGKDTMQHWLDTLQYAGLKDTLQYAALTGRAVVKQIDTFWLDNSVRVTADEQLGLVKRLYFHQLPFFNRPQDMVKGMMLQENNSDYKLSYKTGWGHTDKGHALGWIVGWIEENIHPYFFVLQIESADPQYDMGAVRLKILKEILKQYGFMEGKK